MGEFRYVDKDDLKIDGAYQRDLKEEARRIAKNWDENKVEVLTVNERPDGSLWLVNGHQRWGAAMMLEEVRLLPCHVVRLPGREEEAELFGALDANRVRITPFERYRAALAAADELAWFVEDLCDDLNVKVVGRSARAVGELNCINALLNRAKVNRESTRRALALAKETADADEVPITKPLFLGLAYLDYGIEQGNGLSNPILRKRLKAVGARKLVDAANRGAGLESSRTWGPFGRGMLKAVNGSSTVRKVRLDKEVELAILI